MVGAEAQGVESGASGFQCRPAVFEGGAALRPDAAKSDRARRQALVGVVDAQAQAVLGARGEHPVRLGDAAGDQVVDHHAEVRIGAGDGDAVAAAGGAGPH